MNNEELRQVRDTLIEALRASDILTLEGRALFRRYEAKSNEAMAAAAAGPAIPGPEPRPGPVPTPDPVTRRRAAADDEEEDFGGSFMVRNAPSQPAVPGYREMPPVDPDLPRSMRDRRR